MNKITTVSSIYKVTTASKMNKLTMGSSIYKIAVSTIKKITIVSSFYK